MSRAVSGPEALVRYIQTGDRNARIAYRELPEKERIAYRDLVNRVYAAALARHFGDEPEEDAVYELVDQVGERHPQYRGGVKRVLNALVVGSRRSGGISPRQVLTAQHLIIREIAKIHSDFRKRANEVVAQARGRQGGSGEQADVAAIYEAAAAATAGDHERLRDEFEERMRAFEAQRETEADVEFTGTDGDALVSVTLGLDGSLRALELQRGVERVGGKTIASAVLRAWVGAEKQRWTAANELGAHDSAPEPGSGSNKDDTFRSEAYSASRLCRAAVDRHGRLYNVTFMRTSLFGTDGRHGLASDIREAIEGAQAALEASL